MLRSADIPVPTINSGAKNTSSMKWSRQRGKWKDSNSEVTTLCHFDARWRLQHIKLLKSTLFATLHPCLELCPRLTMPTCTYVPCTCEVYSVHVYTQYRRLSEHLVSMVHCIVILEVMCWACLVHSRVTLYSNSRNCCRMYSCYYTTWSPGFSTWPPVIPWKPDV